MDLVKGVVWQEFSQTASMDALRKAQALLERKVELMHKYNIVHNDLHPGNVLVVGKTKGAVQDVVIIDFGKSVEIDQKYVFHNDDEKVKAMVMERNMRFTAECISAELVRLGAVRI
jgi:predicted unusual protein kinase regulating ubiquinone biosynthesis (AarF/ABC1/UbiB family)